MRKIVFLFALFFALFIVALAACQKEEIALSPQQTSSLINGSHPLGEGFIQQNFNQVSAEFAATPN